MKQIPWKSASAALAAGFVLSAQAVVIDFTGGTAFMHNPPGGSAGTTVGAETYQNVDYYEENGFRLDFIGNESGAVPFAAIVGNYYDALNDVIHGHWSTGDFGNLTSIKVTKIGGGTFDLNYFILTSNTDTGGAAASGNERAFITHDGGANPILLPPQPRP